MIHIIALIYSHYMLRLQLILVRRNVNEYEPIYQFFFLLPSVETAWLSALVSSLFVLSHEHHKSTMMTRYGHYESLPFLFHYTTRFFLRLSLFHSLTLTHTHSFSLYFALDFSEETIRCRKLRFMTMVPRFLH